MDAPQYVNTQYPWEGREEIRPGQIPERFNPTASYVKYFCVPERMRGKRVFISFQGAESAVAVWLNGAFVGIQRGTRFTPSDFETDGVPPGRREQAGGPGPLNGPPGAGARTRISTGSPDSTAAYISTPCRRCISGI